MARDGDIIRFRGLQGRTLADQERALAAGFESVRDHAVDELARMLHELTQRVDDLENKIETIEEQLPFRPYLRPVPDAS